MSVFKACMPDVENLEILIWQLKGELGISEIAARLLINRGITIAEQAKIFLRPTLENLHDPYALSGMDRAVQRIKTALAQNEKITVYGDYDVDGLTAVTVLYLYLKSIGGVVEVYIPDRHKEGYGLNEAAINNIINGGTSLIITVDCGITSVKEANCAKALGVDMIITDHHNPGPYLPDVLAIINPKLVQAYPFKELAGVGVAGKLVQALGGLDALKSYLDLIAIGTVADIVPLTDENRILVSKGIDQINYTPRPGVQALISATGIDKRVNASRISYGLAPCLNAPGRLTTFHKGFKLLTASDENEALPLASILVDQNIKRRELERGILTSAKEMVEQQVDLNKDKIIIVAGEGWHSGVIGIVASKITNIYNRPSIIISFEDDEGVASARSIKGFDLYRALSASSDLLVRFGGHEHAAGLTIKRASLTVFRERMRDYANENITDQMLLPCHIYDGVLTSDDISPALHKEIDSMAPFGAGNPSPRFLLNTALVENSYPVGKDAKHLKMTLELAQRSWDAIGFGLADTAGDIHQGCQVSLLTSLTLNEWMGVSKTQFQIHSMKREYESQKDIDTLLDSFYYKFFNVFLSEFMYNSNGATKINALDNQNRASIDMDQINDFVKTSPVGTAVLVYNVVTSMNILGNILKAGLMDEISICYNKPNPAEGIGKNTIILAPVLDSFPWRHYRTLIIPSADMSFAASRLQNLSKIDGDIIELYIDKPGSSIKDYIPKLMIEREDMAAVYKWVRALMPGRDVWPNQEHLLIACNHGTGLKLNSFQLLMALEVFKELDFMVMDIKNQFIRLSCNKNPVNRPLVESKLYTFYKSWIEAVNI